MAPLLDPANTRENSSRDFWRAFFQALRARGYVEWQNLVTDRSAVNTPKTSFNLADEIIHAKPDAALAFSQLVIELARKSGTLPIVGTMGDPVGLKTVESLAWPGGNLTGVSVDAGVET
jgi:putative ABC transport system substrate-binding protein